MKNINRNSTSNPMPLFQFVKESIKENILNGTYIAHQKLPSEREMTEDYSVSRITIRQALSELQRDGLIIKINGKGTFVTKPKAQFDVSKLSGFGESAASLGLDSFSKLISITTGKRTIDIAEKLNMKRAQAITKIERLRFLNREAIAFDTTYAAADIGERISPIELKKRDIFDILENDFGIPVCSAEVNVEAITCDESLAHYLDIEKHSAVLHIERTILGKDKLPILYENLFYRGDSFKFGLSIDRSHL